MLILCGNRQGEGLGVLLGAAPYQFPLPVTCGLTRDPKPGKWRIIYLTAEIKKGRTLGCSKTNHSFKMEGKKSDGWYYGMGVLALCSSPYSKLVLWAVLHPAKVYPSNYFLLFFVVPLCDTFLNSWRLGVNSEPEARWNSQDRGWVPVEQQQAHRASTHHTTWSYTFTAAQPFRLLTEALASTRSLVILLKSLSILQYVKNCNFVPCHCGTDWCKPILDHISWRLCMKEGGQFLA